MSFINSPETTQRTSHPGLYEYAFHGYLTEDASTIIDFGAGDNHYGFGEQAKKLGHTVTRVDAQYADQPPEGEDWISANVINPDEMAVVPDHSHDVAVSSFLFQHLSDEDQVSALQQMRRVTKFATDKSESIGNLMIYPVFRAGKLHAVESKHQGLVRISDLYVPIESDLYFRDFKYPTLIIRNIAGYQDVYDELFAKIAESQGLRRTPIARVPTILGKLAASLGRDTRRKY